jgi:peptidoglycan/LPS O-acetylase OafA/YrhL
MQIAQKHDYGSIWIPSTPLPHMLQLDALRAFAVLAVLVGHFTPTTSKFYLPFKLVDLGGLGVRLFFVISGFLITGILLRSKSYREKDRLPLLYEFRQFYARRVLRIFPLFYLVLGFAALLDIPPVRETFGWHAAYLTNFYLFFTGRGGSTSHLWSLAVEEQFYLVWPWIILLVSRRRLSAVILVTIAIGPIFRLLCGLYTGNHRTPILPMSCLDTLGVGAFLALRRDQAGQQYCRKYPFGKSGLLLGVGVMAMFVLLRAMNHGRMIGYAIFDVGVALIAGWIVWNASIGIRGPIGKLLEVKPLLYLGTISYGIYIYHNFIHYLLDRPEITNILALLHAGSLTNLLICATTIFVAALSWHLFERPINDLKRYFNYGRDRSLKKAALSA